MLRVKIPIGSTFLEVEAETEEDLETAIRVARRSFENEPKPKQGVAAKVVTRPTSFGDSPSVQESQSGVGAVKLSYSSSQSNADRLYTAMKDLGKRNGYEEVFARSVMEHLEATGGKLNSKAKKPIHIVRQILRNDRRFKSTGKGWKLHEWEDSNEKSQEPSSWGQGDLYGKSGEKE